MRPVTRLIGRKSLTINLSNGYTLDDGLYISTATPPFQEAADRSFEGYVAGAYKASGPVFACILARMMPFSEVRFQLQEIVDGRPGKLFNDASLSILDQPWPNGTTGELLARMEQDVSLAGNFYASPVQGRLRRLRPDWVKIISGVPRNPDASAWQLDAQLLGYVYEPPGVDAVFLTPSEVVHYSPIPDPQYQWRGMSWLTPVIREVTADLAGTKHKEKFYKNGAALSTVIKYDPTVQPDNLKRYVALFNEQHQGPDNAYKTLHIGGGADVTAIGTAMSGDFRAIQGAGETRIAAAAGVGAIIARFSEGLAGSALNQGNYNAARRQFADMTIRPLWRIAAASLSKLVTVTGAQRLWYDDRDVQFLKEDRKDAADILATTATTMRQLVDAGYTPESVVDAVETGDLTRLKHSGMFSVQLQPAGATVTTGPAKALEDALLKVGARNSSADLALIQSAHDAIVGAGATCPT